MKIQNIIIAFLLLVIGAGGGIWYSSKSSAIVKEGLERTILKYDTSEIRNSSHDQKTILKGMYRSKNSRDNRYRGRNY